MPKEICSCGFALDNICLTVDVDGKEIEEITTVCRRCDYIDVGEVFDRLIEREARKHGAS